MKRRGSASASNALSKKWSGQETRSLVEYAKKGLGIGSPKSESFWNDFPGCKTTGSNRRTPNSCKLRYRAVGPKVSLPAVPVERSHSQSTSIDLSSDESLAEHDSDSCNSSVPDDHSSSGHSNNSQGSSKGEAGVPKGDGIVSCSKPTTSTADTTGLHATCEGEKSEAGPLKGADIVSCEKSTAPTTNTRFHVDSQELESYLLMYNDVQRYASYPMYELARNAKNLILTIRLIYNMARESDVDDLSDTESQIKKLLSTSSEQKIVFAQLTAFNILNSHKCTKYYVLKKSLSRVPSLSNEPGPVVAKDKRGVDYVCKVTFLTKDLKLIASLAPTQLKRALAVLDDVYGDRIPGNNVVITILSIDPKNATLLGDCYSRVADEILRVPCRLIVPVQLLEAMQPNDVFIALDYQQSGDYFVPCNPVAKCTNMLIIKQKQFDKNKLLSTYQRKHGALSGSNIVTTTISIPVYKDYLQVEVKLDGTETYNYEAKTCKELKIVVVFHNDSDDVCSVKALSNVKYQYVNDFVVDGKSKLGWYGETTVKSNTEFTFKVTSLETNYNVKVSITNKD